jgi:hypothetical protein
VNTTHLHLMVNHLPVILTPVVGLMLLWGLIRGSREITRLAAGMAVIVAALSYPVFLTGEPAEEGVEDAPWLTERMVHDHEERAEAALIAVLVTGVLATVLLWQSREGKELSKRTAGVTLAGLAVSAGLFGWTALAGGIIRHDEIRSGAQAVAPVDSMPGSRAEGEEHDGDKDD